MNDWRKPKWIRNRYQDIRLFMIWYCSRLFRTREILVNVLHVCIVNWPRNGMQSARIIFNNRTIFKMNIKPKRIHIQYNTFVNTTIALMASTHTVAYMLLFTYVVLWILISTSFFRYLLKTHKIHQKPFLYAAHCSEMDFFSLFFPFKSLQVAFKPSFFIR